MTLSRRTFIGTRTQTLAHPRRTASDFEVTPQGRCSCGRGPVKLFKWEQEPELRRDLSREAPPRVVTVADLLKSQVGRRAKGERVKTNSDKVDFESREKERQEDGSAMRPPCTLDQSSIVVGRG